jgi:cytochrome c
MTWNCRAAALAMLGFAVAAHAEGDSAQGKKLFESRCIACHSVDSHRVGPALRGVVGRRAGAAPGYDYSAAVKGSGFVWTAQSLDRWLSNPEALIPGQKMGYSVGDVRDRADLIAYLKATTDTEQRP